jgi:2'-5' RNA ligase
MQIKRLFIAAELPQEVIQNVNQIVKQQWSKEINGVKWVDRQQYHLTLKFLGDTSIDQIPAISQICQQSTSDNLHLPLQIQGFGVFPNQQKPSVLWAGINQAETLIVYQRKLDKNLNQLNIPLERRAFKPHLTLARIKDYFPMSQLNSLLAPISNGNELLNVNTSICAITLFESELSKQGPIYKIIWTQNIH